MAFERVLLSNKSFLKLWRMHYWWVSAVLILIAAVSLVSLVRQKVFFEKANVAEQTVVGDWRDQHADAAWALDTWVRCRNGITIGKEHFPDTTIEGCRMVVVVLEHDRMDAAAGFDALDGMLSRLKTVEADQSMPWELWTFSTAELRWLRWSGLAALILLAGFSLLNAWLSEVERRLFLQAMADYHDCVSKAATTFQQQLAALIPPKPNA